MIQELVDSIDKRIAKHISNMHTVIPAVIDKFNEETCTVAVIPKAQYRMPDGTTIDYPKINNVPLVYPHSGTITIAFPVKKGDNCLLVFGEKSLDYWRYNRDTGKEMSFDLTDAIAIPSMNPLPDSIVRLAAKEHAVIVKTEGVTLKISDDGVTISGSVAVEGSMTLNGEPVATITEETQ